MIYTEDGSITASLPPNPDDILDVTEGIEKSVELEQELSRKSWECWFVLQMDQFRLPTMLKSQLL